MMLGYRTLAALGLVLAAEAAVLRGDGAPMLRLVTGREPGSISVV